jgi:hypothetical protein
MNLFRIVSLGLLLAVLFTFMFVPWFSHVALTSIALENIGATGFGKERSPNTQWVIALWLSVFIIGIHCFFLQKWTIEILFFLLVGIHYSVMGAMINASVMISSRASSCGPGANDLLQ